MELSGRLHASAALLSAERVLFPIEQVAGLAPEPVWTIWGREERLVSEGDRTICSDFQLVACTSCACGNKRKEFV